MEVYIKQDPEEPSIKRPEYEGDVGYDLFARSEPEIVGVKGKGGTYRSIDYIQYDTKLVIAPTNENSFYAMVYPRSSISKHNLALANSVGVIDSGFRNTVKVRFRYIFQPKDIVIKESNIEGVKIASSHGLDAVRGHEVAIQWLECESGKGCVARALIVGISLNQIGIERL